MPVFAYPFSTSEHCWSKLLDEDVEEVVETECNGVDLGVVVGGAALYPP